MSKKTVGEILREERKKQKKTIQEVSSKTFIHEDYIRAIENDEFDKLPSETYAVGFIVNYAEFLGLDPEPLVSRYKSMLIEESPTPNQLIMQRDETSPIFARIGVVISALIVVVGVAFLFSMFLRGGEESGYMLKLEQETDAFVKYSKLVKPSEEFKIPSHLGDIPIKLININPDKSIDVSVGGKIITIKLHETAEVDINEDNETDVKIRLPGFAGKDVRLDFVVMKSEQVEKIKKEEIPGAVLIKSAKPEKTDVVVEVGGKCWISYKIDNRPEVSKVFDRGAKINLTFSDSLKVLSSDSSFISISIDGESLKSGKPGTMFYSVFEWKNVKGKAFALIRTDLK